MLEQRRTATGAVSTIVELPAVADAYIASARPNENFGAGALFLGYNLNGGDAFGAERMLLRFALDSAVPENAVINSARLRLYLIFSQPENDEAMGTIIRRLASAWEEDAVTWNTEPTWASVRDESSVGSTMGWYEWNITDLVTAWAQDELTNYGVEIIGDENIQQRERAFYSRETTTALFPRLVVDYTVVDDVEPPEVSVEPLPPYSDRSFTVSWSGMDIGTAGIRYYDVQYQVDGGDWVNWQTNVTSTSAEFVGGSNGHTYAFRARGVDNVGNVEPFGDAEAQTLVDTIAPASQVNPLPTFSPGYSFTVSWSGTDNASGIQFYDVRYRINGGPWLLWQNDTIATSAPFTAFEDGIYDFEVRAVDQAGHMEVFTGVPEANIIVDQAEPFVIPRSWLPIILVSASPS